MAEREGLDYALFGNNSECLSWKRLMDPDSAVRRTGWSYIRDCVGEPLEDFS